VFTDSTLIRRLGKVGQPEFYEAAGNRFAILLFNDPNTDDGYIGARAAKVFEQNPDTIDTVLVLVRLNAQVPIFKYLVIERDGSWSEMCGNGARAVALYLQDSDPVKYARQPITLVTKSGKQVIVQSVERDGKILYQVNMGQVSSIEENQEPFQDLLGEGFDGNLEKFGLENLILNELNKYLENPNLLRKLFPNLNPDGKPNPLSIYSHYFHEILQRVNEESEFGEFVQALKYRGLYQAGGEPHTLIEITDPEIVNILGEDRFSDYLKAASFVLRHLRDKEGRRLYPQSMNFMFYTVQPAPDGTTDTQEQGVAVKMYPAERGVHNGVNYDQTGACGTGSCCLGNYLLKHDSRFTDLNEITIVNRSGIPLIVALDNKGNTQLTGQAERTNR